MARPIQVRHRANPASGFLLEKWYLDCVTAAGDVFVGYAATLRWRRLRLRYASLLRLGGRDQEPESRTTLRGGRGPAVADGEITWDCPPLALAGRWSATAGPLPERTLFADDEGETRWSCLQPRSSCSVRATGRPSLTGWATPSA